ncbi:hypothetical protein Back11_59130 [Paenibacillus baekrokdamisoli]|uniref:Uncharacterized protein n=1 Tax=Paenibacillus baekrokdamisoli TaxID=1712516 RepID=A0A3G9JKB4_9BACL|nr:hypothetical protein [Paenibacillus baekrokdamisoli]MBB3071398.1 hypothetical protein [Paenibacillus baekrokdamisoli]BBH24568.1 hypothetical protein Back11_59130 [Paenibacillus baekrokdamisoli]
MVYAKPALANGMPPGVIMIDDNWHEPNGTWNVRFPIKEALLQEISFFDRGI